MARYSATLYNINNFSKQQAVAGFRPLPLCVPKG
jgi:hypothetical protein